MNKYLTPKMFEILDLIDSSDSAELVNSGNGWWVDDKFINDKDAVHDLLLLRLVKFRKNLGSAHIYSLTEDGEGVLDYNDYVPKIVRV